MGIMENRNDLLGMTTEIVAAFVAASTVQPSELSGLIASVYQALLRLSDANAVQDEPPKEPAVAIKRSITPDFLVCLEDGRKFKSLKRHLRSKFNMSPEDYKRKWGLPKDYPMVAPNYAKARSELARQMGLGQVSRTADSTGSAS